MNRVFSIFCLLLSLFALPAGAETEIPRSPAPSVSPDPLVSVAPPTSYKVKKYFLFPLELPSYVLRGATWPLLELGKFLERNEGLLAFEQRDWSVFPVLEFFGGDGFGGGVFFQYQDLFHRGYRLRADYRIHTNLDQTAHLRLDSPPLVYLWDRPFSYRVLANFRNNPNSRFYGTGPDSLESDRAEYGFNRVRGGVELNYDIFAPFRLTLPVEFMTVGSGQGPAGDVQVQDVFPASELSGFERRLGYFITGLTLTHDTTDSEDLPTRGGLRSFRYSRYQGLGTTQFDYNEYFLDIRQYFRLWTPRHILALRNAWQFQQGDVPFYLLSDLDWKTFLRGFDRGRFRDENYLLFNVEYRFPVWDYVGGSIFLDTGRVFDNFSDLSFKNWRYSAGGGLNFFIRDFFLFRVQVGYGGEGAQVIFQAGPSF